MLVSSLQVLLYSLQTMYRLFDSIFIMLLLSIKTLQANLFATSSATLSSIY